MAEVLSPMVQVLLPWYRYSVQWLGYIYHGTVAQSNGAGTESNGVGTFTLVHALGQWCRYCWGSNSIWIQYVLFRKEHQNIKEYQNILTAMNDLDWSVKLNFIDINISLAFKPQIYTRVSSFDETVRDARHPMPTDRWCSDRMTTLKRVRPIVCGSPAP